MKRENISTKYPKYYRQRFIITLLQYLNNSLTWSEFQSILFLSQRETEISYYDFVLSCNKFYSFEAANDVQVLNRLGWIEIKNNRIILLHKLPSEKGLTQPEAKKLSMFIRKKKYFKEQCLFSVCTKTYKQNPHPDGLILFTIGYEGVSFDEYINNLLQNSIRLLCDVRINPVSRKFGFSKRNLSEILPKLGIEYLHIPELGVLSSNRKELHTTSDYHRLFAKYNKDLENKKQFLSMLTDSIFKFKKIALTCFEQEPLFCHRHCISDYIKKERNIKVIHL